MELLGLFFNYRGYWDYCDFRKSQNSENSINGVPFPTPFVSCVVARRRLQWRLYSPPVIASMDTISTTPFCICTFNIHLNLYLRGGRTRKLTATSRTVTQLPEGIAAQSDFFGILGILGFRKQPIITK